MKTMAFAAVAGFAGLATASPFFSTSQTATEIYSAPAGAVATITVDISGFNTWDLAGAAVNETLDVALGGDYLVTGIGWNVTIASFGASWRSEATIGFSDSSIGLQLSPGTDSSPGTGTYTSGGILDLASIDPTFPFTVGADGILSLEFYETFDDVPNAIDATFLSGSSLQVQYVVPAPGALAMLGLGGLVAGRRRR